MTMASAYLSALCSLVYVQQHCRTSPVIEFGLWVGGMCNVLDLASQLGESPSSNTGARWLQVAAAEPRPKCKGHDHGNSGTSSQG